MQQSHITNMVMVPLPQVHVRFLLQVIAHNMHLQHFFITQKHLPEHMLHFPFFKNLHLFLEPYPPIKQVLMGGYVVQEEPLRL